MRARRAAILSIFAVWDVSAAIGCSSKDIFRLEIGDRTFDYAFALVLDGAGHPTRITQPFGVRQGKLSFGALPSFVIAGGERTFVLVTMTSAAVAQAAPGFQTDRAAELGVTLEAPPESAVPERSDAAHPMETSALPSDAEIRARPIESASPLASDSALSAKVRGLVSLHVPYDPEFCRIAGESAMKPFGAAEEPLAYVGTETPAGRIVSVAYLDPDWIAGVTQRFVFLLRRGRMGGDDPSDHLLLADPLKDGGDFLLYDLAIDPRPDPGGRRHVVVAGGKSRYLGRIFDLYADQGGLHLAATTTVSGIGFHAAAYDDDGRLLVGGTEGHMLVRETGATAFSPMTAEIMRDQPGDLNGVTRIVITHDAMFPYFAATLNRVHLYQRSSDQWTFHDFYEQSSASAETADGLQFESLAASHADDGSLELWAGAHQGFLARRIGTEDWRPIMPAYPPSFGPCGSSDGTSRIVWVGRFHALQMGGGYLHLVLSNCAVVLQIRRADLWASTVPWATRPIGRMNDDVSALAVGDHRALVGGDGGLLLESVW